jgi:uncharacterized protein YndB with AHSA1/START domain
MSHQILLAINVDAPPERVFEILTTNEGQRAFWTADCDVEGDHARFGFEGAPVDLVVAVHAEPVRLVQMKVTSGFPFWEGSTWEWELSQNHHSENGTTVMFRHYGFTEGISENDLGGTAQTWAMTLQHLANFVTSGIPQPYFATSAG